MKPQQLPRDLGEAFLSLLTRGTLESTTWNCKKPLKTEWRNGIEIDSFPHWDYMNPYVIKWGVILSCYINEVLILDASMRKKTENWTFPMEAPEFEARLILHPPTRLPSWCQGHVRCLETTPWSLDDSTHKKKGKLGGFKMRKCASLIFGRVGFLLLIESNATSIWKL